jgi:hypothetical protein
VPERRYCGRGIWDQAKTYILRQEFQRVCEPVHYIRQNKNGTEMIQFLKQSAYFFKRYFVPQNYFRALLVFSVEKKMKYIRTPLN